MQKRMLGREGLEVSALGLGTMMMLNNEESVRTIQEHWIWRDDVLYSGS